MLKNVMKLGFFVFLFFMAVQTGCSKKDEVKELKEQLAQAQSQAEDWKKRYEAVSMDYAKSKAQRRDLRTNLNSMVDSVDMTSKTAEQQIYIYQQQVVDLQTQIQDLNSYVDQQDAIIADQEAAIQEFVNMFGQPANGQIQNNVTGVNAGYDDTGTAAGY